MSAGYRISSDAVIILNQAADEMESVCKCVEEVSDALEETAKSFELEFTILEECRELEKLLLEKMEYEDIVIEQEESEPPHHREKLLPYNKRRKFVKKQYWNRIRSRCF